MSAKLRTGGAWLGAALLAFLALVYWISIRQYQPPPAVDASAPDTVFSAARAIGTLERLMPDQEPRPVGSPGHRRFRQRLIDRLTGVGAEVSVQETEHCGERPPCTPIRNVVGVLPGASRGALVLMAHYDGAPGSPAAADNGASVAVLLEVARAVRSGPPPDRTLVLLFTDAEERGGLGADAFFRDHPLASRAEAVVNFDGSGSSGPSRVLRSAPGSGAHLEAYTEHAKHPVVHSIREYLFERHGSGSDFSEVVEAELPGLDFTFVGDRATWHSPRDRLERLSPRTVQHHGENALAVVGALGRGALPSGGGDRAYVTLADHRVLSWPTGRVPWALLGLAAAPLVAASLRLRGRTSPRELAAVAGGSAALLLTAGLTVRAALWVGDTLAGGRPTWPTEPLGWRTALYGPTALLLLPARAVARRLGPLPVFVTVGWILCAVASVANALDPKLAPPFVLTALAAGAASAGPAFLERSASAVAAAGALLAAVAGLAFFPLAYMAEVTYGFTGAIHVFWPLAMVLLACVPILATRARPLSPPPDLTRDGSRA